MKYLHIFNNTNEKFSEPFIKFINNNFNDNEHFFYHIGEDKRTNKIIRDNTDFVTKLKYFKLINDLYKAKKIFLHSLFSPYLVLILFMQPWLLRKSYWCIWGGDLYFYKYRNKSFKSNIYEMVRRNVIQHMGSLITNIKGDYKLAQKWYDAKGTYHYCFMYPSNLYREYNMAQVRRDNKFYIQIGNSADPSNNHLEVFKKLESYKDNNIEILCPLSYGDSKYKDSIIIEGYKIFKEKFKPLTNFIPLKEYLSLLAKVDVAIFNHERQQGMGNIITLLGLGKKVYIRDEITTWDFFNDLGLKVFNFNDNLDNLFKDIDISTKEKNIENIKNNFNEEKLIKDWNAIFQN